MSGYFIDSFSDNKTSGKAIGNQVSCDVTRKGIDIEGVISIDNSTLRIKPLVQPGWGRAGIVYGPYTRTNGLAFAAFLVNGHNTSQMGYIDEGLKTRLYTWVRGSETEKRFRDVFLKRLFLLLTTCPSKKNVLRRFLYWCKFTAKGNHLPLIHENLSVGWFPQEAPSNPLERGNGFIVHAACHENGELWTHVGSNMLAALKGLQNLQVYYIVILRRAGAAYYAASVANANGLTAYPDMRPIAIDPFNTDPIVYAGIHQSVQGEIGFWVDTRVYSTQVQQVPELATWYGTAVVADKLIGDDLLGNSNAEIGGLWTSYKGNYERKSKGSVPISGDSLAVLDPTIPIGLIHIILETSDKVTTAGVIWRFKDPENFWIFLLGAEGCQLQIRESGIYKNVGFSDNWHLEPNSIHSLQILDEGKAFSLCIDGKSIFSFSDARLHDATGTGIGAFESNQGLYFRCFEAHPRSIPIPDQLDLGSPWIKEGKKIVVNDNFEGIQGKDLTGKTTTVGQRTWKRALGTGKIELTGSGSAKVRANTQNHNPGRTAYIAAWENTDFADLSIDITPPGTGRGQGEKGRGGLIFWQDSKNYIIINNWVDDYFAGSSISSFFTINSFEDLYDAVWTNVGNRVCWGVTHQLRVVFDGLNYLAFINGEPVLYRSLKDVYPNVQRLKINGVGLVANWEWGDDTGSIFENFVAKV